MTSENNIKHEHLNLFFLNIYLFFDSNLRNGRDRYLSPGRKTYRNSKNEVPLKGPYWHCNFKVFFETPEKKTYPSELCLLSHFFRFWTIFVFAARIMPKIPFFKFLSKMYPHTIQAHPVQVSSGFVEHI